MGFFKKLYDYFDKHSVEEKPIEVEIPKEKFKPLPNTGLGIAGAPYVVSSQKVYNRGHNVPVAGGNPISSTVPKSKFGNYEYLRNKLLISHNIDIHSSSTSKYSYEIMKILCEVNKYSKGYQDKVITTSIDISATNMARLLMAIASLDDSNSFNFFIRYPSTKSPMYDVKFLLSDTFQKDDKKYEIPRFIWDVDCIEDDDDADNGLTLDIVDAYKNENTYVTVFFRGWA